MFNLPIKVIVISLFAIFSANIIAAPLLITKNKLSFNESMCMKLFKYGDKEARSAMMDYCEHSAEKEDSVLSQTILGQIYSIEKEGYQLNYKKAAYWYQKSADKGNVPSKVRLARILMQDHDGIKKNLEKSRILLEYAYKKRDIDAPYYLAVLTMLNDGLTLNDVVIACKYSVISSRMGSQKGSNGFQTIIGQLYRINKELADNKVKECHILAENEIRSEWILLIDKQEIKEPLKVYSGPKAIHSPEFWLELLVD